MQIKRKLIDNKIEEKILTGMIVDTQFMKEIHRMIKKDTFVIPYTNIIYKWIADYFKIYNESPKVHIQDIFELEKSNIIKEDEKEIIAAYLSKLSNNYEQEASFNREYLKDKAVQYVKKRSLRTAADKILHLIELDRIDEAEKEVTRYKQVSKETSGVFDPFSDFEVKQYFHDLEDRTNILFSFPGALGKLLGEMERHWLVGILAPSKKGKSFWEQEFAVAALLEGKRVLFISLEMSKSKVKRRLYKRMTGFADESGEQKYPCFDCRKNQFDTCKKKERTNQIKLMNEEGNKPIYDKDADYRPCIACRGKKDYVAGTWFMMIKRDAMKQANTLRVIRGVRQAFADKLRIKAYPAFSANIADVMADLNELDVAEGFNPDVVVIDYADILAPEDNRVTGRERIDETWKTLKMLSDKHHCLVVTASQSNRKSFDKKYVDVTDIAEDIRKIANSDLFIALNQTPTEKREGVMRVNCIIDRDSAFDSYVSCLCLQQLDCGQVCLDSEMMLKGDNEENALEEAME
jgi:replicative DNA helicase